MSVFVSVDSLVNGAVFSTLPSWLIGYGGLQTLLTPGAGALLTLRPAGDLVDTVDVFPNRDGSGVPLDQPIAADADGRFGGFAAQPAELDAHIVRPGSAELVLPVGSARDLVTLTDVHTVASDAAMLALPNQHEGMIAIRSDLDGAAFVHNAGSAGTDADWNEIGFGSKLSDLAPPAADVSMAGHKLTSLGDATAATDAVNRESGDALYKTATTLLAAPSGGDDGALLNAAITANCLILLGPGTFNWQTVPRIPKDATRVQIRGAGRGVTTIALSASAQRAFDFNRTADYDTFQNVTLEDFTVDGAALAGHNETDHVVLGTMQAGVTQMRLNVTGVRIRRVDTVNVPVDSTGSNHRLNVWLISKHAAAGEGTQTVVKDVVVEDCRFNGGNQGVTYGGSGAAGTGLNVLIDDVHILRCWHSMGVAQTAPGIQAHFFIGSAAQGGRCSIQDCYGFGSGDVGIEIDAMTDAYIRRVIMEDCSVAFYHTNFNNPVDPDVQRVTFDSCVAITKTRTDQRKGFYLARNNAVALGELLYRNCIVYKNANLIGVASSQDDTAFACVSGMAIKKITLDGCTTVNEGWTFTAGASTAREILYAPGTSGSQPTTRIVIRNHRLRLNGAQSGGALTMQGFAIGGAVDFQLDGLTVDWNISGSPTIAGSIPVEFGQLANCTLSGHLRGLVVANINSGLASSPHVIQIRGTGTLSIPKRFDIEYCDFSQMTDGTEINFVTTGQNQAPVFFRGNVRRVYPKVAAAMSTSSFASGAFTTGVGNQYIGSNDAVIVMTGGAGVTAIDRSVDGVNWFNVWTQASGVLSQSVNIPITNGEYLRVTFATTQPVTTVIPAIH